MIETVTQNIWHDIITIGILGLIAAWVYTKKTGKSFKELVEQVKEVFNNEP